MGLMNDIEKGFKKATLPTFEVGDTVDVHVRIKEGDKERIQIFNGTVICVRGSELRKTFTVRRIVQGEGVERVFPIHSPRIADVVVKRKGSVRRAKLFYLRGRTGKATKVKEKIVESASATTATPQPTPATPSAPKPAPAASTK